MKWDSLQMAKAVIVLTSRMVLIVMVAGIVLTGLLFGVTAGALSLAHAALAPLQAATPTAQPSPQRLTITPTKAIVGAKIDATADGLPANTSGRFGLENCAWRLGDRG